MNHRDLIVGCQQDWDDYIKHDFVRQLGKGTLPEASFRHYLQQDYLYLIHYTRAFGLAIFKSNSPEQMREVMPSLSALVDHELSMHIEYCKGWGLSTEDLLALPEGVATVAYTRYLIDAGMQGDLVDLYAALVPCALGYAEVGQFLAQSEDTLKENNPYQSWIDMYAGEEYQEAAYATVEAFDRLLAEIPVESERAKRLQNHFAIASRMESAFWQQGLDISL
ncbi:MAG: thiaminase II [Pontibacterium sp.]